MTNCVGTAPCKRLIRCRAGWGGGYRQEEEEEEDFCRDEINALFSVVHRLGSWAAAKPAASVKIRKSAEKKKKKRKKAVTAARELLQTEA